MHRSCATPTKDERNGSKLPLPRPRRVLRSEATNTARPHLGELVSATPLNRRPACLRVSVLPFHPSGAARYAQHRCIQALPPPPLVSRQMSVRRECRSGLAGLASLTYLPRWPNRQAQKRVAMSQLRSFINPWLGVTLLTSAALALAACVAPADTSSSNPAGPAASASGPPSWSLVIPGPARNQISVSVNAATADIAVIDWGGQSTEAVNLASSKVLWTKTAGMDLFSAGGLVFLTGKANSIEVVATASGKVVATIADDANNPFDVVYQNDSVAITGGDMDSRLCARTVAKPGSCAWQGQTLSAVTPPAFGNGWINTASGVREVTTGKPAPFGADAAQGSQIPGDSDQTKVQDPGVPTVFYAGPTASALLRFEVMVTSDNPTGAYSVQPWSATNQPGSGVTALAGVPYDDTWNLPALYVANNSDADNTSQISAYSWSTGQQLWQAPLQWAEGDVWAFDNVVFATDLAIDQQAGDDNDSSNAVILDAASGQQLWQGSGYAVLPTTDHSGVVTLVKDQMLDAFDATSAGFNPMWQLPLPADDAAVFVVGQRIVAASPSTGQIWALTTAG